MKNNPWDEIEDSTNKIDFNAIIADKESVLDFYWAKDYYGQLLFILHTNSDIIINEKIPNLNGLTINVGSLKEKKQLVLTLQDISNADLFYIICSDLINTTKQLNDELIAIKKILKRLSQWQYFLKNNNKQIDKNQLKGLIGELYLFKKLLSNFSIYEVLNFWKAPLGSVHDFELLNSTLEVKTKSSVNSITISSFEQMFSELENLFLFVVTLNESSKTSLDSFNIYDLIFDIKKLINFDDIDSCERLDNLLFAYGFIELEEYKELYFSIIHDEIYHVCDDFPRIMSKPNGVDDLTYKINLEKCKDYIVIDVIEKIRGKIK
ncbi:PD-(D/E)XK motif protein [Arcobacter sp. AHV-9/2010]|uniref:PD-(D/E)XK motif protein n=1 Tax=Arcobacter sp. AHV-9/2010 TaxID=2021861 RepID=UPI0013E94CDF|nr:PD-(D/E)XK motif protein [Arcobacter sp. CECT 9299]